MVNPRKVLQVLWSGDMGGSERCAHELALHLPDYGFDSTVCFLTRPSVLGPVLATEGIPSFSLDMRNGLDAFALRKLRTYLENEKFDIIHEHGGNKLAVHAYRHYSPQSKTLFTIHNGEPADSYKWLRLRAEISKMRAFDRVLCVSRARAAEWEAKTRRPVFYEPNGIDTDRFPVQSSVSPDFPLITVGRLIESKRTGLLIFLLADFLKRTGKKLWIVGDGPERENIERQIRGASLEKSVSLLGNRNDVPVLMKQASVFVTASRIEAFPLAVLEASCAGLPVVAMKNDGVGAVAVNGITGFIAETEANFLPLVERLFADDIIRFQMGTSARARIMENFSLPHYVSRIAVHYEMLLGES